MQGLLWKWGFYLKISSYSGKKAPSWNMTMGTSFQLVASLQEMFSSMGMPLEMLGMSSSVTESPFRRWYLYCSTVNRREKRIISRQVTVAIYVKVAISCAKSANCQQSVENTWPKTARLGASSKGAIRVWPSTSLTRPNVDQLSCQSSWKYARIKIRGKVDRRLFLSRKEIVRKR